jgi:hypothetical protein
MLHTPGTDARRLGTMHDVVVRELLLLPCASGIKHELPRFDVLSNNPFAVRRERDTNYRPPVWTLRASNMLQQRCLLFPSTLQANRHIRSTLISTPFPPALPFSQRQGPN